jgi:hypothetical protein
VEFRLASDGVKLLSAMRLTPPLVMLGAGWVVMIVGFGVATQMPKPWGHVLLLGIGVVGIFFFAWIRLRYGTGKD